MIVTRVYRAYLIMIVGRVWASAPPCPKNDGMETVRSRRRRYAAVRIDGMDQTPERGHMMRQRLSFRVLLTGLLAGVCAMLVGCSVVGTTVDVATTTVGTAVDIVTLPLP